MMSLLSDSAEALTFMEWLHHVGEILHEDVIFAVGLLIIFGLIGGKLISLLHFPKVTGYILVGILVGPSLFHLVFGETAEPVFFSEHMIESLKVIRKVAIGFIGYTIGLELKISKLRKTGKQVTIITLAQALLTAVLVGAAVVIYKGQFTPLGEESYKWTYGLILGAIATATAPGPIVAVVKSYRTKGPVTDVLLPLVALDDAIGIILFAVMLSLGTSIISGPVSASQMIVAPAMEIGFSLLFGGILGFTLSYVTRKFNRENDAFLMMTIIGVVFFGIGLGFAVHASQILLPMTIGVILTNTVDERFEHRLTQTTDLFTAPILLAFFTIAGLELQLELIPAAGVLGAIYIAVRVIGKVYGATFSGKAVKAPPTVVKYLGYTLIPQAGVAIDMALTAKTRFEMEDMVALGADVVEIGSIIMTVVLAATVIYEVFGLIVVKTALFKAGEIDAAVGDWE